MIMKLYVHVVHPIHFEFTPLSKIQKTVHHIATVVSLWRRSNNLVFFELVPFFSTRITSIIFIGVIHLEVWLKFVFWLNFREFLWRIQHIVWQDTPSTTPALAVLTVELLLNFAVLYVGVVNVDASDCNQNNEDWKECATPCYDWILEYEIEKKNFEWYSWWSLY